MGGRAASRRSLDLHFLWGRCLVNSNLSIAVNPLFRPSILLILLERHLNGLKEFWVFFLIYDLFRLKEGVLILKDGALRKLVKHVVDWA